MAAGDDRVKKRRTRRLFFVATTRVTTACLAFWLAKEVFAKNDEQDNQGADIKTKHVAFKNNQKQYDNPKNLATCIFRLEQATAAAVKASE